MATLSLFELLFFQPESALATPALPPSIFYESMKASASSSLAKTKSACSKAAKTVSEKNWIKNTAERLKPNGTSLSDANFPTSRRASLLLVMKKLVL